MNSRPLLDYLTYSDDFPEPEEAVSAMDERPIDPLEARLKDLEARLRANQSVAAAPKQDLTLSAQIDAILKRKAAPQAMASQRSVSHQPAAFRHAAAQTDYVEQPLRPTRVFIDPPPSVPASNDLPAVDHDFLKFSEAVYLIGQAARRFIEEPQVPAQPAPRQVAMAPSTGDIEALSAVLRETVSAFRSVADDLAVSAGEIRNYATRPERMPERRPEPVPQAMHEYRSERRRPQPARHREEDEILELRENIADLQDRLDDLLHARRRARY